jgi:predicted amidohydrolase
MSRRVSVGALQLQAHDRAAFSTAWPEILERTKHAAKSGVQLLVLPEGTIPGYIIGYEAFDNAIVERAVSDLQAVALESKTVIVAGVVRLRSGRLFNSAVVIDNDGSVAGAADKRFLWGFDRQWFTAGDCLEPMQTKIGKLGALVCADVRAPLIARTLVDRGAEVLVMPTAWVTSGRDPQQLENPLADLLARVRARENSVPFVCANKCGVERGCVAYCGKSQIVDARGERLALASERHVEFISGEISTRDPLPPRSAMAVVPNVEPTSACYHIAISTSERGPSAEQLRILEADQSPVPIASVDDTTLLDPAGLLPFRAAGYQVFVWRTSCEPTWCERFARARATELRIYVVVLSPQRAFAVDPDGVVIAGTFEGFNTTCFVFDGNKTMQTLVAPRTDIVEELFRTE